MAESCPLIMHMTVVRVRVRLIYPHASLPVAGTRSREMGLGFMRVDGIGFEVQANLTEEFTNTSHLPKAYTCHYEALNQSSLAERNRQLILPVV